MELTVWHQLENTAAWLLLLGVVSLALGSVAALAGWGLDVWSRRRGGSR